MTANTFKSKNSYLIIQRKSFIRLALPYEVILDSWCCTLDEKTLLGKEAAEDFVRSLAFSKDTLVLELAQITQRNNAYSFSKLVTVFFNSNESLELFFDKNYANFNIRSLNCKVLNGADYAEISLFSHFNIPQNPASKSDLVPVDGVLALVFDKLTNETKSLSELKNLFLDKQELHEIIIAMFEPEVRSEIDEVEIFKIFINLCLENSFDVGWAPEEVIQALHSRLDKEIKDKEKFKKWDEKVRNLLFGSSKLDIPLGDNGSIILRAIILVLLNPQLANLIALKKGFGLKIGKYVFNTAKKLTLLRTGYSLLNYTERENIGKLRIFIQDLNAALYNNELSNLFDSEENVLNSQVQTSDCDNVSIEIGRFNLAEISFITELNEKIGDSKVYSVKNIVPNAGFKSEIIQKSNDVLYFWLIDTRNKEKKSKYKAGIAIGLLNIQSVLPSGYRFETNDEGVYLRLPSYIANESDLLNVLKLVYKKLLLVKAFNRRKSTISR